MKNINETSINYSIRQDILKMNNDQLNLVAQAIRDRREIINLEIKSQYVVGDLVSFKSKNDGRVKGVISKINPKSIEVEVDKYNIWKVSPSLLKKEVA